MAIFQCVMLLVILVCTEKSDATDLSIGRGSPIILRLPGAECGKYTLLNGLLHPVLVIEKNVPKLLGKYRERANITESDSGYNLTIHDAQLQDDGRYKVASSRAECKDIQFYVTVKEVHDPIDQPITRTNLVQHTNQTNTQTIPSLTQEFLEQWGDWSECAVDCDKGGSRSRTRNCSVNGGCEDMGDITETQTCDLADHCAHWSSWGSFGECSAKCGKGFKIRSRNCLKGTSSLLQTGDCVGPSIQSHMCMIMCEVVGVWTGWSEWSDCTPDCGDGRTRNRTRVCNDPRETPNCFGNYTEHEECGVISCNEFRNETTNGTHSVNPVNETEVAKQTWLSELNLVVMLVMLGAITLIVLIVVFMFARRRLQVKRVNSSRLTRDTQVEHATIDKRLTQANKRASRPDGVNVYSELGSSFCYNDSEFDDSDDDEDDTNKAETDNNTNAARETGTGNTANTSKEGQENNTNSARDGDSTVEITEVNIYDNNPQEVNIEALLRNLSNDSIYSQPPDEEDPADEINPDEVFVESNVSKKNETKENGESIVNELTGLFVDPPVEKLSAGPGTGKSLDGMYRKVNKNRDKPNKVEINHANDVYYDPPVYSESAEPEPEAGINIEPEVDFDDNVYENCDVKDGKTEIVPIKSNNVHSKMELDCESKSEKDKHDIKEETPATKSDIDLHPKLKESLEDVGESYPLSDNSGTEANETKQSVDDDHVYVNDDIREDIQDFYVTPRYSQQHQQHIYDIPRSPT